MPASKRTVTIQQLAEQHSIAERKLRRVARKHTPDFAPGRGNRYSLTAAQAKQLLTHC